MKHRALRAIFAIVSIAVFAAPLAFSSINNDLNFFHIQSTYAQGVPANDSNEVNPPGQNEGSGTSKMDSHCEAASPGSWVSGCMTPAIITVGGWALWVGSGTFDIFINETLNPSYFEQTYVTESWRTLRDIANLTFILGIIAVAFMMITGAGFAGTDWKKLATRLVIVALLLNFSLFFSKAIIDVGNIFGNFFYEQMVEDAPMRTINAGAMATRSSDGDDTAQVPSASAKLAQYAEIDQILDPETLEESLRESQKNAFWFSFNILYLVASLLVAWSLFKAGFAMLSRLVWLILLTIASPLAFVSLFIPKLDSFFRQWLSKMLNKSFCVCIYLFILYVLVQVMSASVVGLSVGTDDWSQTVIAIMINVAIIFGFIKAADIVSEKMCDDPQFSVGSIAMKTTLGAAALVGGGAAGFAARATLGRAGHQIANTAAGGWAYDQEKGPVKRTLGKLALYGGQGLEKQRYGMKKDYNTKLLDETKERRNIYENVRNRARDKAEAEIKATGDAKHVQNGTLTKAGRDIAKARAEAAGKQYLSSIKNSPIDLALAGGVAAGRETNLNVQKSQEADKRTTEKFKALRQQQMAIEGDRSERDQATDIGTNKAIDALNNLKSSLTNDGVAIDRQSLSDLKDAFYGSYREITDYNSDGSPILELTEKARASADTAWGKVQTRLTEISTTATEKIQNNENALKQTTSERDNLATNEAALTTLLKKLKSSEQNGGVDIEDISKSEQQAAQQAGIDISETEEGIKEIKYNVNTLTQLNAAQQQAAEKKQSLSSEATKLQKESEALIKETQQNAERTLKAANRMAKSNTKALADTERSDLNARAENITEERAVLQDYLAEVKGIAYETDPFSTDSDTVGR